MTSSQAQAWVLPREDASPALARRHLEATCTDVEPERLDIARLLATELVTNALLHGAGPVVLVLDRTGEGMRVGVEDDSPTLPVSDAEPLEESGRGLQLVATLAEAWGVAARGDGRPGKRVWFDLGDGGAGPAPSDRSGDGARALE